MTHDPHARYDADGLLTQIRCRLDRYDAERRTIDEEDESLALYMLVGMMEDTLKDVWTLMQQSDIKRDGMSLAQPRALETQQ